MSTNPNQEPGKKDEASGGGSPPPPPPPRKELPPRKSSEPYVNKDTDPPERFLDILLGTEDFHAVENDVKADMLGTIATEGDQLKEEADATVAKFEGMCSSSPSSGAAKPPGQPEPGPDGDAGDEADH